MPPRSAVSEKLRDYWQTLEGEHAKTALEFALHSLAKTTAGRQMISLWRGGERITDDRLRTNIAGIDFENPVMIGAGWDKKGWAIDGLYYLGASAAEIPVLLYSQYGNDRPRLHYDTRHHTALNSFGEVKLMA